MSQSHFLIDMESLYKCMMGQAGQGHEPSYNIPFYPGSSYEKELNQNGFCFRNGRVKCYPPSVGNLYISPKNYGQNAWNTFQINFAANQKKNK